MSKDEIIKLYNLKEAAGHLMLSVERLRKLCREGKIQARKIRRKYFFTPQEINHLLGE